MREYDVFFGEQYLGRVVAYEYSEALEKGISLAKKLQNDKCDLNKVRVTDELKNIFSRHTC